MLEFKLRVAHAIGEIPADAWDACANPAPSASPDHALGLGYNPFISHAFLSSLELSSSVRARSGWKPMHLLAESADGLVGAVPCYVKSHSRGEYVFDNGWAEAYERAGGSYYPKLQVSAPFTPATGRRLLARPGPTAEAVRAALADALIDICRRSNASSVHVTFATEPEWQLLGQHGFLKRTHQQYHWENAGYDSFEAFLAALASRKRKTIRRERADALAAGISVHWLTGSDLTERIWDAFFEFYMETGSRKWGRPYLTRQFYSLVGERMRDRILLVMAKRNDRWIAGAINFIGSDTLFGRHWGCIEHHPFLHFELCYYQAIDYAITHKLARVEAGAQGEHKIARGYLPTTTYSAHYIDDPALRRAISDFLQRERAYVAAADEELADAAPFRRA
ncbi:MAG: N-acetyltransferase [Hyphomicrobiales bacterium]|nr:N-acetyltransferase [Hyphomicrobiales bacterium]